MTLVISARHGFAIILSRGAAMARVFVFDDDEPVRAMVTRLLERRGHEVFSFAGPTRCERCHCAGSELSCADILVSDVSMPGLGGIAFLEHQRSLGCRVPYMALMSGCWEEEDAARARALGCRVFEKPFDPEAFCDWIQDCSERVPAGRKLSPAFLNRARSGERGSGC